MTRAVLVCLRGAQWFALRKERGSKQARAIRTSYEEGQLRVVVPPLLVLELLNVASRRWAWDEGELPALVTATEELGFEFALPRAGAGGVLGRRGLTAYDATYVALAERHRLQLITDDSTIAAIAPDIAVPLVAART